MAKLARCLLVKDRERNSQKIFYNYVGLIVWMDNFNCWNYPAFVLILQQIQQFLPDLPVFGITIGLVIR
ncbi:hypothetical protein T4D_520 [Trichinella pseudospiralis]|uniref:Uncharacterized protein n=1 Tax=Trichinella pseudospiralis TaxID=6337 RepID=A0A0V1FHN7_TRIPS|nr:hypothetical protein T4D_520 [Trichinella pseudospiralis]